MQMLSISFVKDLVYGAIALSLMLSLCTIVATILMAARGRRRLWSWALAAPLGACALVGWVWVYPSFVAGTLFGMEVGAIIGRRLPAIADAVLMSVGIGLGTYLVFSAPLALLALGLTRAVTTNRTAGEEIVSVARTVSVNRRERWIASVRRVILNMFTGSAARTR